jgi:long-chain fatty acid transport protein
MKKQGQVAVFVVCMLLGFAFFCAQAYAGGINLYEVGPSQTALASAGWASRADDASTLFTNPAGMTRLKQSEFLGGIQPLYTDLKFSPDGRTTTTGSSGSTRQIIPTGDLYYVHNVSPDLKLGMGVLGYFGLAQDYGHGWVGRYYVTSNKLQGLTIQPSAAYKLTDKLSVGAGLNAMYATMEQKMGINNVVLPDGQLKLTDTTWGYGANLGILYEFDSKTRFGINYLSQVNLDFSARPRITGSPLLNVALASRGLSNLDLTVHVPQTVMVSFYRQLNDRWGIMGDVGWQQWSQFGRVDVSVNSDDPRDLTTALQYKDTWHFALGAQYQLSKPWLLMFGASYDSSAVKGANMSVALPMGETYRFGAGTQYRWNNHLSLAFAYELVWLGTLNVDQERGPLSGRVAGEYNSAAIHALQVALRYQF